jgi:hypothetical protein
MIGLTRDEKHHYSWNGSPKVPGVTSVIKMLDKSGPLIGWAKRETAACAIRNLPMLETMVKSGGPDAAQRWLSSIPDFQRDTAADLGSRVHLIAESITRGHEVEVDEAAAPYVDAYRRWYEATKPEVTHAEYMVFSEKHRYGGTADMSALIDGHRWLIDIKTGKSAYAETALQLAALHFADFSGRPGDETRYRIPRATRFGVLHIRPEGAALIPYDVTRDEFTAFLACRRLYDWQAERAPVIKQSEERKAA